MVLVLTLAAFVLAWIVFRAERLSRRRRAVAEALGVLDSLLFSMDQARGTGRLGGWGQSYFNESWSGKRLEDRADQARKAVVGRQPLDQVFAVPTEPLAALACARPSPGLLSEEVVSVAGEALWRVGIFNQLVAKQTAWNVQHLAEIQDPNTSDERLKALGEAAAQISYELHGWGVGDGTTATGGEWYKNLRDRIVENRLALRPRKQPSAVSRYFEQGWYVVGDAVVVVIAVAALALAVWDETHDDDDRPARACGWSAYSSPERRDGRGMFRDSTREAWCVTQFEVPPTFPHRR